MGCARTLPPAFRDHPEYPNLDGGLLFRASGQYGSIYDEVEGQLVIAVCDTCLKTEGRDGGVIRESPPLDYPPPPGISAWDPDHDPYARAIEEEEHGTAPLHLRPSLQPSVHGKAARVLQAGGRDRQGRC